MSKKVIFHIIDSLSTGGAEILLANTINILPEYEHVVIYLGSPQVISSLFNKKIIFYNLDHSSWKDTIKSVLRLNKIIKRHRPILIHSHLLKSTWITRLRKRRNIPHVGTVHSTYSVDAFSKNRLA